MNTRIFGLKVHNEEKGRVQEEDFVPACFDFVENGLKASLYRKDCVKMQSIEKSGE